MKGSLSIRDHRISYSGDIFEDMRAFAGCEYISDLKNEPYRSEAACFLSCVDLNKYRQKDAEDAKKYIEFSG